MSSLMRKTRRNMAKNACIKEGVKPNRMYRKDGSKDSCSGTKIAYDHIFKKNKGEE